MSEALFIGVYLLPPLVWLAFNIGNIVWNFENAFIVVLAVTLWPWTLLVHSWAGRSNA